MNERKTDERQRQQDDEENQGAVFESLADCDLNSIERPVSDEVQDNSDNGEVQSAHGSVDNNTERGRCACPDQAAFRFPLVA